MSCDTPYERISAYLDGELPEAERERFAAHLRDCAECSRALANARVLGRAIGSLGAPSAEPAPASRLAALLAAGEARAAADASVASDATLPITPRHARPAPLSGSAVEVDAAKGPAVRTGGGSESARELGSEPRGAERGFGGDPSGHRSGESRGAPGRVSGEAAPLPPVAVLPYPGRDPESSSELGSAPSGERDVARTLRRTRAWALAATLALAVLGAFDVGSWWTARLAPPASVAAIVSSHERSLLDEHLLDVPSSDRHTVKPWFSGKLEFAPRVLDLADAGFPLAGGRLDVIEGRRVAALVYRADHHIINLFVRPGARRDGSDAGTFEGYGYERWREGDLEYWAVSDVDRPRLATFAQTWRARAGGA